MNCEAVRELLWMYLEKETTAEDAEKIEKHLAECEDCREELELQKEMMETLAGLPEEELPEGYHEELMQKLRVEAAPNVVAFPQKKKKQPMWKQLSMIAAAVLVVVAAGGMNGMLEMRESQNAVVSQMSATDAAAPAEASDDGMVVYDEVTDVTEDYLEDMDPSEPTYSKKKKVSAAGAAVTNDSAEMKAYDAVAVPQAASVEEEMTSSYDLRSMVVESTDKVILMVENVDTALAQVQKTIVEAGGHEETASAENAIIAVIPAENFHDFSKDLDGIGELNWTMQEQSAEGLAEHRIEIQLHKK